MDDKIHINQKQIIEKLKSLLEIKYIYKIRFGKEESLKPLLILILKGGCSSLTTELSSMVAKIFQEETDFLYRIFSFEYAQQQLIEENLFFVNACNWNNIIYHEISSKLDVFFEYYPNEKLLSRIEENFHKEHSKIIAFLEGAQFYTEKDNLKQAAFMLQQCIELWFRFAALLAMGKERKSHSIKELQTYIRSYLPELGNLFNTEIEEEQGLLKLVDDAYVVTRYENSYHINLNQIHSIFQKANTIESIVANLFKFKIEACHKDLVKQDLNPKSFIKEETPLSKEIPKTNENLILDKLKKLSEEHYYTLKPNAHKKGVFNINLLTDGYLETSFMISNLLKVCIMALEADYVPNRLVQEPEHNIKEVLGYILYMMPYEEMEFLDKVKDLLAGIESNCPT